MKVILESKNGVSDLDGNFYNFIAGDCTADDTACYFQTEYGVLMVKRDDVGLALLVNDETDLVDAVADRALIWLVN